MARIQRKSYSRGDDKMFKVVFAAWLVWVTFCLALLGTVIYVAAHFIAKYW